MATSNGVNPETNIPQNPANKETDKKTVSDLPAIRTYKTDITDYTKKEGASYLDIISQAAHLKKDHNALHQEEKFNFSLKTALLIGGVIVSVLGLGIGAYFYLNADQKQIEQLAARSPQPLIRADVEKIIIYQKDDFLKDIIQKKIKIPQLSAHFTYFPIKEEMDGRTKFLNGSEFFQASKINIPFEINVNLIAPFTFGVIDTLGQNEILILSRLKDFERTFAALLLWEKEMLEDLTPLLPADKNLIAEENVFKDKVIENNDARIIYNLENKPILAYAIFNKNILVIASSETALEAALEKLIISPPIF